MTQQTDLVGPYWLNRPAVAGSPKSNGLVPGSALRAPAQHVCSALGVEHSLAQRKCTVVWSSVTAAQNSGMASQSSAMSREEGDMLCRE